MKFNFIKWQSLILLLFPNICAINKGLNTPACFPSVLKMLLGVEKYEFMFLKFVTMCKHYVTSGARMRLSIARVIPKSLNLQAQGTLASLG
jgi:hypothetical protein